ncbi:SDR family oxidoreductase [Bacteroidota bacterium]
MSKLNFKNNVIIITGASAGIGKELALQLAWQSAKLVLAARDTVKLRTLVKECNKLGGKAVAAKTDISDKLQCKRLINKTIKEFGRIDTLINNAGLSMWAKFDEIKNPDMLKQIMDVNYLGSVYTTFYALPYLKKSKGRIVGISSLTGKTGVPTRTGYAASKHAMAGFFDSLRIELMNSGVSVTMIYPDFVATEVRERALGKDGKPLKQSHIKESGIMTAEECAAQIIDTAAKRKRELVMTPRAKAGLWLKLIAPKIVDNIARKSIESGKT